MNYLKQIVAFNERQLTNPLPPGQLSLWHALMDVNNRCHWQEWFTVANSRIELYTRLSRQGIDKARNALKELGFIDFKSNGMSAMSYKIVKLYEESPPSYLQYEQTHDDVVASQEPISDGGVTRTLPLEELASGDSVATELSQEEPTRLPNSRPLYKQNKTKQNESDTTSQTLQANFEKLWQLYPRKERRKDAYKAYVKAMKKGVTNKQIQDGIVAYKKHLQQSHTEPRFVKQGGTWFSQECWNDDYSCSLERDETPETPAPSPPSFDERMREIYGDNWKELMHDD